MLKLSQTHILLNDILRVYDFIYDNYGGENKAVH